MSTVCHFFSLFICIDNMNIVPFTWLPSFFPLSPNVRALSKCDALRRLATVYQVAYVETCHFRLIQSFRHIMGLQSCYLRYRNYIVILRNSLRLIVCFLLPVRGNRESKETNQSFFFQTNNFTL